MRIVFLSAALLASQLTTAATPIDGWYSSAFGGLAYLPNNINRTTYGVTRSSASYKTGYDAGGSIGFKSNPMRYEGELTYLNADINRFKVNGIQQTGPTGYSNGVLAMANVYYDFQDILPAIQPNLGVGIGYAWVHATLNSTGPNGLTSFKASNSVFAYQGLAGLTYNFSEKYAINVGYRYAATIKADDFGKIVQASLVNLGVVYRFDDSIYK